MLLWHVGATIAFVRYAFRDPNMDLRYLALGAVLPDLIDTPLGIIFWSSVGAVRLVSHSIMFAMTVMFVVLIVTRRGPTRKRWMLVATGLLFHLLLDVMWNQPETLWWPFLGSAFTSTGFLTYGAYLANLLTNPVVWLGELVGLAYLVILSRRSGLGKASARRTLLTSGVVSARIDRT